MTELDQTNLNGQRPPEPGSDHSATSEGSPDDQTAAEETHPESYGAAEGTSATATDPSASQNSQLQAQLQEKDARYAYLYAEFENFKKRSQRERQDAMKFGFTAVLREFIQIMDNLELALQHASPASDPGLRKGLEMVVREFHAVLNKQGVTQIESLKKIFDPNFHESIGEDHSEEPSGTIIAEHSKGYTLHERLIRPSRVVLSKGKSSVT